MQEHWDRTELARQPSKYTKMRLGTPILVPDMCCPQPEHNAHSGSSSLNTTLPNSNIHSQKRVY